MTNPKFKKKIPLGLIAMLWLNMALRSTKQLRSFEFEPYHQMICYLGWNLFFLIHYLGRILVILEDQNHGSWIISQFYGSNQGQTRTVGKVPF